MGDVMFTNSDGTKIHMDNVEEPVAVGLTKEEVQKFANDPFWVGLRRTLFMVFWMLWIVMLAGAIVIILFTPRCAKPKEPLWYEDFPVYTIHVDQFADSDGDGFGDLTGILSKLPYIRGDISMRAIALEGLLNTDVPTDIRPKLGTIEDFRKLASEIKVIIRVPLSGVVSEIDYSGNLESVLTRWIEAGAAGFILDEFSVDFPSHADKLRDWSNLIGNSTNINDQSEILLALSTPAFTTLPDNFCRYAHMVLNYDMINLSATFFAEELYSVLADLAEVNRTSSCRDSFVLGTAEVIPLENRFQPRSRAEALVIFNMLADATPILYYGDEFGKEDTSGEAKSRSLQPMADAHTGAMHWQDISALKSHPEPNMFKLFQQLASLRLSQPAIRSGQTAIRHLDQAVLAMARIKPGNPAFVVVSNFASHQMVVDLRTSLSKQVPAYGSVVLTSTNSKHARDERLSLEALTIEEGESLVLQFVPETEDSGH